MNWQNTKYFTKNNPNAEEVKQKVIYLLILATVIASVITSVLIAVFSSTF